jgi:addiction module RelE/StbE family toxin
MKIDYHKNFSRQFVKLRRNEQERVLNALKLFENEPFAKRLRNPPLKGNLSQFHSIDAGGDLRLLYFEKEENHIVAVFVAVGSHSQIYG